MIDNVDVAVLTKVNELAARFGFKPYDFVATFKAEERSGGGLDWQLHYEMPASGNALREERFDKMLNTLGIRDEQSAMLSGSVASIVDALDDALEKAPRPRGRL
jgi:hypothetical protein